MGDNLGAVEADVPFDRGGADQLIGQYKAAARIIEDSRGPRQTEGEHALLRRRISIPDQFVSAGARPATDQIGVAVAHVSLNKVRFVVAAMCLLAASCSQSKESTMNEPEARAAVKVYKRNAVEAIKLLGEMEKLPGESDERIETCDSDLTGSYLGSDKMVLKSSWNVTQDGRVRYSAIAERLAEDSMEVTPYTSELGRLSAEDEGFKIIIRFWETDGTSGRVDLTVKSPCIEGLRDDS